ncbi:MAG: hypothetical protein AAGC72_05710 [Planctomycetota bacterium]
MDHIEFKNKFTIDDNAFRGEIVTYATDSTEQSLSNALSGKSWSDIKCDLWHKHWLNLSILTPDALAHFFPSIACCAIIEANSSRSDVPKNICFGLIYVLESAFSDESWNLFVDYLFNHLNDTQKDSVVELLLMLASKPDFSQKYKFLQQLISRFVEKKIFSEIAPSSKMQFKKIKLNDQDAFIQWSLNNIDRYSEDIMAMLGQISMEIPVDTSISINDIDQLFGNILRRV